MNNSKINKIVVYPVFITVVVFLLSAIYMYTHYPTEENKSINMNDILIKSVIISSLIGLAVAAYIHIQSQGKKMRFRMK